MTCGGVVQLYATGKQDVSITGEPEATFFVSNFKRYVNFSQVTHEQMLTGTPTNGGISTVKFERKGDILSYVYLTFTNNFRDWITPVSKVELIIGGQIIDEHDSYYTNIIAPMIASNSYSKSKDSAIFYPELSPLGDRFYPLLFSFFNNWNSGIPLVALPYQDVEIRITWNLLPSGGEWGVYASYIHLDKAERSYFTSRPHDMLITQVQKTIASRTKIQELNLNNPVKCIASTSIPVPGFTNSILVNNKIKFRINGEDVTEYTFANPNYSSVPLYYHTRYGGTDQSNGNQFFLYPFCLDTSKLQPTGALNFSRIESFEIISETSTFNLDIYALSYNIFRIENGICGLMYYN